MLGILISNQIPHQSKVLTTSRTMLLKDYPRRYPSERLFILCQSFCAKGDYLTLYRSSVSLASIIRLPAIPFTFSTNPPPASKASISSPPPILLPLISTLGTVRLPVLLVRAFCRLGPKGWVSSSTT